MFLPLIFVPVVFVETHNFLVSMSKNLRFRTLNHAIFFLRLRMGSFKIEVPIQFMGIISYFASRTRYDIQDRKLPRTEFEDSKYVFHIDARPCSKTFISNRNTWGVIFGCAPNVIVKYTNVIELSIWPSFGYLLFVLNE